MSRPTRTSVVPQATPSAMPPSSRRSMLFLPAVAPLVLPLVTPPAPAVAAPNPANTAVINRNLPDAGVLDFVQFTPARRETPAIRAGTVDPEAPYTFAIPPNWSQDPVANIASGNYCQPRCAEPWTEFLFSNKAEGSMEVIVAPLDRFTNIKGANIETVGTPSGVLDSIGPFLTGNYMEEEDITSADQTKGADGRTYYTYELNAIGARTGPHILAYVTSLGELVYMFKIYASERQWAKNEDRLRKLVATFQASVPRKD